MLLAVDVGNTQTHLGAFEGERLVEHWRFQTRAGATGDELAERIGGLMALRGLGLDDIDAVCVSSVVPPLGSQYEQLTERYLEPSACWSRRGSRPGCRSGSTTRWRSAPTAWSTPSPPTTRSAAPASSSTSAPGSTSTPSPPTASTSAARSRPGLEISLTALVERAARIPRIDLAEPEAAIGRSSRAAIQSGVVFGFAGLIDGVARRIEEELGGARFLATGGLAAAIVPFTETIDEVDDLLTLKGLRLIHDRNAAHSGRSPTRSRSAACAIANRVLLAPLAGIGNWFVRLQAKRHGAGLAVSEMVSSFALHYRNERTLRDLMRIHPDEHPVSIQLFGHDAEVMRSGAAIAAEAGADLIDINMGCPVPKVRRTGAGAAAARAIRTWPWRWPAAPPRAAACRSP